MTSNGTSKYPFFVWPERNIVVDESETNKDLTLLYVLHNCNRHYSVRIAEVTLEEDTHYTRTCVNDPSMSTDITDLSKLTSIITLTLNPSVELNNTNDGLVEIIFEVTALNTSVTSTLSVMKKQPDSNCHSTALEGTEFETAPPVNCSLNSGLTLEMYTSRLFISSACFIASLHFLL